MLPPYFIPSANLLRHNLLLRTTLFGRDPVPLRLQVLRALPVRNAQTLPLRPSGPLVQQAAQRRDQLPADSGGLHQVREMPDQYFQKRRL